MRGGNDATTSGAIAKLKAFLGSPRITIGKISARARTRDSPRIM